MVLFPWLFLILLLVLLAQLVIVLPGALRGLVVERRFRVTRPSARLILVLTLLELLIVLIWGLFLRPRLE